MTNFKKFTKKFQVTKTLEFELKPDNNTEEYIKRKKLIQQDEEKNSDSKKVQKIMDERHKQFIHECLNNLTFDEKELEKYSECYRKKNKNDAEKKELTSLKKKLLKTISDKFTKNDKYKNLFDVNPDFVINNIDKELLKKFKTNSGYFNHYNENRKNLYSSDDKNSTIAYRLINDILPQFLNNLGKYEEIKNIINLSSYDDIFKISYFNKILIQTGIDCYNEKIGGSTNGNIKIKGLNEIINEYNQTNKKDKPLLKFKQLFKQILTDELSNYIENFETDNDVSSAIEKNDIKKVLNDVDELFVNLKTFKLDKIYINNKSITHISKKLFGNWDLLNRVLIDFYDSSTMKSNQKEKWLKRDFDIQTLNEIIKSSNLDEIKDKIKNGFDLIETIITEGFTHKIKINEKYDKLELRKKIYGNNNNIIKIREYLDSVNEILYFIKYFKSDSDDKDDTFYDAYSTILETLSLNTPIYNKIRNYITKRPYSKDKFKLNFENKGNVGGGFTESYTDSSDNATQYGAYLFRKKNAIHEYDFFLGISADSKILRCKNSNNVSDPSDYERLEYYKVNPDSFYGSSYKGDYTIERTQILKTIHNFVKNNNDDDFKTTKDEILKKIKENDSFTPNGCINIIKKNKQVYQSLLKDSHFQKLNVNLISNIKETIKSNKRYNLTDISNIVDKNYVDFSEIMADIDTLLGKSVCRYVHVSKKEWEEVTTRDEKRLLLFKISNKDLDFADTFNQGKRKAKLDENSNILKDKDGHVVRGKDNLHTIYLKKILEEGNSDILDIGTANMFYRKASIKHSDKIMRDGHHYNELKEKFKYPIIKNNRFTKNKYKLHLSFTINHQCAKKYDINKDVLYFLKDNKDINILSIDRGERNLLYITIINRNGEIQFQESLNTIKNEFKTINYQEKLVQKEKERDHARKNWTEIEPIKDLKNGFLGGIIPYITKLMIKHNAVISLENLTYDFKQNRKKFEREIYQKFEEKLIKKLNYYWTKEKESKELGGVLNAYQLTNKFDSFDNLGLQSGFLFYVSPAYTSNICPKTGFVNFLRTNYDNVQKSKKFFNSFNSIKYNNIKNYFEFEFDYKNFPKYNINNPDLAQSIDKTKWIACTNNEKLKYNKVLKSYEKIDVTNGLIELFENEGINYKSCVDIKSNIESSDNKDFFMKLMNFLYLTLSIRQKDETNDYILSPIMDNNGDFFDSRKANSDEPKDADANGAYHIGLKTKLLLDKINDSDLSKKVDLIVKSVDWLNFMQNKYTFCEVEKNVSEIVL